MHLYVHVPFCARRCSYCDFSIAVRRSIPEDAFVAAVTAEWAQRGSSAEWTGEEGGGEARIVTVYFGGGTPSKLSPPAIGRLIDRFRADRGLVPDAEITLEANPEDVTPEHARGWRAAGITRVSLGVQSFDPAVLAWMHRTHRAEQVVSAVAAVRDAGIANLSLDLIYGLPSHLARDWMRDVERALACEPQHLSLYALTVEPATPLGRWVQRERVRMAEDERTADEYLDAMERLQRAGYAPYEVSNAARPGFASRHNRACWRRAPYLGLGPSAHSAAGTRRCWNIAAWEAYRRAIAAGQSALAGEETLTGTQVALEALYLGLRTEDGMPAEWVPPSGEVVRWRREGWVQDRNDRVVLTPAGWFRLDALVARLAGEIPAELGLQARELPNRPARS